jgi:hypothetical protein
MALFEGLAIWKGKGNCEGRVGVCEVFCMLSPLSVLMTLPGDGVYCLVVIVIIADFAL